MTTLQTKLEETKRLKYKELKNMPEYRARLNAQQRCHNPNYRYYSTYGGRGIKLCDRWRGEGAFMRFIEDMGFKPTPQHSLDRIDNDGNYEPSNCRWATRSVQVINRRPLGKNNDKGYRGMSFNKRQGKWLARITVNGKDIYLGYYDNVDDAARAYNKVAKKYHGEFAMLNNVPDVEQRTHLNTIKAEIEAPSSKEGE